jgi:cobalt/nickel transport system permease protein
MRVAPDARLILLGVVAYVVVVALTPPGRWPRLGAEAVLAAVALGVARVPVGWALGRLAVLAPFVGLALFSAPFMRPVEGLSPAVFLGSALAKALLSFAALAVLAHRVAAADLLIALARLRVPPILVSLMALMLRYLEILEGEARRMLRARDARGTPPTLRQRARVTGYMIGSLFLRSYVRSERISQSMLARGFDGTLVRHTPLPLSARDWGFVVAVAILLTAVVVVT